MRQAIELIKNHLSDIEILHNNDTTKDEFLLGLHYGSEGELKNVIEMPLIFVMIQLMYVSIVHFYVLVNSLKDVVNIIATIMFLNVRQHKEY